MEFIERKDFNNGSNNSTSLKSVAIPLKTMKTSKSDQKITKKEEKQSLIQGADFAVNDSEDTEELQFVSNETEEGRWQLLKGRPRSASEETIQLTPL